MTPQFPEAGTRFIVVVIAAIIWFALLGHRDLIEPDEARYSEIPREMVASGDWITPRLNDFKYFEKPAFQYWMTAISFELFGESNASARLWTALIGFVCGLFIWYLGTQLFNPDAGFYGFIITLSSLLFVGMGHYLTLDMTVSVFMVLGIGSLAIAQVRRSNPTQLRNWMLAGWAALALAVLAKGLIGIVLPGGAVVVYSLWQRDWALWKNLHLFKGLLLFLLLTAPWFVAVSLANEEFAEFFFIHEHFDRYTSTVHQREGSILYFIPIFILGVAPWLVSSLKALFNPGFSWKPASGEGFDPIRFLWVFVVLTFVFFSLGSSKLAAYILPIMPIVALLAGNKLGEKPGIKGDAWSMLATATLFLVVGIIVTRFASDKIPVELFQGYRWWIIAGALILYAGSFALFRSAQHPQRNIAIAGLCALLGYQSFIWGFQEIAPSRSSRDIARAMEENHLLDVPVYSYRTYPQSLPFYLGRTIHLVMFRGELKMGIGVEPEKWVSSAKEFAQRWKAESQAVMVTSKNRFQHFRETDLPMRIIYSGPRRIAVAKQ
jgi:4-amino-4-deoxy-L-arabinose transferase-like glycosyltransferase